MRVFVEQGMCTGAGVCEVLAPEVFGLDDRGLASVRIDGLLAPDGGFPEGASVPVEFADLVREAEASCPGGCIVVLED